MKNIRVTVWNEFLHETMFQEIRDIYPKGIHGCIADFLKEAGFEDIKTATLEEPQHGLTDEVLEHRCAYMVGHMAHDRVEDSVVDKVHRRVLDGMGLIVLHSGHASKIMRKLCGTDSQLLRWREAGEKEILWVVDPSHPIVEGLPDRIEIEHEEMYGETFIIPNPDELIFISWFEGERCLDPALHTNVDVARCSISAQGTNPSPHSSTNIYKKVIINAVKWAKPLNMPKVQLGEIKEPIMPIANPTLNVIEGLHNKK